MIRSLRNRMPPEVFSLIPHHRERQGCRERRYADRNLTPMTHVCRRRRKILTLHRSLWTHLDFRDPNKTRVYIERSRSQHRPHRDRRVCLLRRFLSWGDPTPQPTRIIDHDGIPTTHLEHCSHFPSPALILEELKILVNDEGVPVSSLVTSPFSTQCFLNTPHCEN